MPRPVFGNHLEYGFPGASHSRSFTHGGGRVCLWVISLLGSTALPTVTFNGIAGSAVFAYSTPIWRVFTSAGEIAAGTVTIAFSGLTSGHLTFVLAQSVANWSGTVRAPFQAPSTTYQHTGAAVTADETFVANWLEAAADFLTDQVEPALVANNAETSLVGGEIINNGDDVRQFIVFKSSATGAATIKVVESVSAPAGFGNSSISMIFVGVVAPPTTNAPPVITYGGGGLNGNLGPATFNYTHTGGRVMIGAYTRVGPAVTAISAGGVAAGAVRVTNSIAPSSVWNIFITPTNVPPGVIAVNLTGVTSASIGVCLATSITGWDGTLTLGIKNTTTPFLSPLGTTPTGRALHLAFWGVGENTGVTSQTFTPAAGTTILTTRAAISPDGGTTPMVVAALTKLDAPTDSGANSIAASQSGWGAPHWCELSFCLYGLPPQVYTQSVGGNLSFAGGMGRTLNARRTLAGGVSFNGSVTKRSTKPLTGALSFTGVISIFQFAKRSIGGNLSFGGAIGAGKAKPQDVGGNLSFNGGVIRKMQKGLFGVLSFVGDLVLGGSAIPGTGDDDLYAWFRRKRHRG